MTSRSKQALADAYVRILQEGVSETPTVSRLAAEAGVTRRTFYRHYNCVGEALGFAMGLRGSRFAENCGLPAGSSAQDYALAIFRYWSANMDFLETLRASGNASMAITAWMEGASSSLHGLSPDAVRGNTAALYLGEFMFGGLAAVLIAWSADERRPPAHVMARIVALPLKSRPSDLRA